MRHNYGSGSGHNFASVRSQSSLGARGRGETYSTGDTRLELTVAIKILPVQLSSDPIRKQRFEREAKTISTLVVNRDAGLNKK